MFSRGKLVQCEWEWRPQLANGHHYLVKTFLAIVFEVFGVNVNLIFVHSVRPAILGCVVDKFFHLHCGFFLSQNVERLDRDKGRCYTVLRNQKIRVCHLIWFF